MQVEYAFFASDAAIDDNGTTISAQRIGITHLTVTGTPATCPSFCVVLSVRFTPDEFDRENDIALHLVGPDGLQIAPPWAWQIHPTALGAVPPDSFFANHVLRYEAVTLSCTGRYECRILLDGSEAKTIAFEVVRAHGSVPAGIGRSTAAYPS